MTTGELIRTVRQEAGITQQEMARRLYVTRQAVSRWETGETTPSIDMVKLICVTFGVPLERFFDMPDSYFCQCCGMPLDDPQLHGSEKDGAISNDYCRFCYDHGAFTAPDVSMDDFIEATAPITAEEMGISLDEAVSMMSAHLPRLKRWQEAVQGEE